MSYLRTFIPTLIRLLKIMSSLLMLFFLSLQSVLLSQFLFTLRRFHGHRAHSSGAVVATVALQNT